jgi:thiosulfate/3-mercaptopyruvate sulfurtransferase
MTDPLVSTEWLAARLGSPDVQVVDGSWHMPAENRSGRAEYGAVHIPGAVFFDIDEIADRTTDLPHMLPSPEVFAAAAGALGLRREACVVAYDTNGVRSAARVWWTLRVMGFPHVRVLDGGLPKWRAEGRPVTAEPASPAPGRLEPFFRRELVRGLEEMRRLSERPAEQVVDARSAERFRGEAPEPRAGLRSGHLPHSLNLPFNALLTDNGEMKPPAELRALFEGAGVDLKRAIVTSCGSGLTASVLALALARIGREDVAVYDGSWTEWAGREDTPVVTGP